MASSTDSDGCVAFQIPGIDEPCKTYYKISGSITTERTPLLIVHGGPGASHDYLLPLMDLSSSGVPLIFYDQVGNGRSTHLRHLKDHQDFWTVDLFLNELENLLAHLGLSNRLIDVYGHSWGGMVAASWAARKPQNLRRLIVSNSLASISSWAAGLEQLRMRLPQDVQDVLRRGELDQDFASEEYQAAMGVFFSRHLSLKQPWPCEQSQAMFASLSEDTTVYSTMYGPSELYLTGSLRGWECISRLKDIGVPTLVLSGDQDLAQEITVKPFFEYIPRVKWMKLDNSAHFSHVDQREKYMRYLLDFIE